MTSQRAKEGYERYYGAISRQYTPDRVPVVPGVNAYTFANWYGKTPGDTNKDPDLILELSKKAIEELGAWDVDNRIALYYCGTDFQSLIRVLLPGIDLPDESTNIADEKDVMTLEDYDKIVERGWEDFYRNELWPRINQCSKEDYAKTFKTMEESIEIDKRLSKDLDMELAWTNAINIAHPFFMLSLGRSFTPFTEDLFFKGDKVEKAIKVINEYQIQQALKAIELSGTKAMEYTEERASAYMFPLKIFERFWLPYAIEFVETMWSKGVVTVMHCDTNWIKNMPYFKEFPKGSVCVQFDSTTPMREVKELLGDHIQYWGDVPATLLAFGQPDEVTAYCKGLIKDVGYDGGFVLSAACETPPDCKKENFRAMLEAARSSRY